MFTGIIQNRGTVAAVRSRGEGREIWIDEAAIAGELATGGSVSVNGCCLSAEEIDGNRFRLYCTPETLDRTTAGDLTAEDVVNLELPLRPAARLGGHFVQGHVDGVGEVQDVEALDGSWFFRFRVPETVGPYLVEKGSVAVDGISLTIAKIRADKITVALIPHTLNHTTLKFKRIGSRVNIECDQVGKYIENFCGARKTKNVVIY